MVLVVLAAGYATRLYPLTRDQPKHLLPVAGRPILEHVLEKLASIEGIERTYVVTNAKFAGHFRDWAAGFEGDLRPEIVDDSTSGEETRLGAIGDLHFLLEDEAIDDDLIVVAGDNLFSADLGSFGEFARERGTPVLAVYDVESLDEIRRYNAVEVDDEGRVTYFEEKPDRPRSTTTGIALYFYPRSTLALIRRYVAEGNNPDQPGRLIEWLYPRTPVYTWPVPGSWYDIGSPETLAEADRIFSSTQS